MKQVFKRILSDKIIRRVITLFTGSALGVLIYFLLQPLITRLYTPEELGVYALIFSIVSMFSTVINGHYDLTIVSAKTDEEADKLAILSFFLSLVLIALIGIILLIVLIFFPQMLQESGWWTLSACLFLVVFSANNILTSYNNRYLQYRVISKVSILKNTARALLQILLGIFKFGFLGVLIGNFIGYLVGVRSQANFIKGNFSRFKVVKFDDIRYVAKKHYKQPLLSAPGLFFVAASNSLLTFFIGLLYGAEELGYFFLSINILSVPISLISSNMGKVFFQSANEEKNLTGTFKTTLKKTSFILVAMTVPIFTALYFVAEPLFSFVFGEIWVKAGYYVTLQVPMYAVRFIVTSVMFAFIISGNQTKKLVLQMGFLVWSGLAIFITTKFDLPIDDFIVLINTLFLINYCVMYLFILKDSLKDNRLKE